LPISAPGIAATTLYGFILAWGDFIFARTFLVSNQRLWTVTLGVSSMQGEYVTGWNEVMAAAQVGALPVVVMYFFLERYLVGGLAAGAVK
jgi:multiple sugar transport system permease protein